MNYAKIDKNTKEVIKYPYSKSSLMEDNPYSLFDDRFDIIEWYSMTDDGITGDFEIVSITILDFPEDFDSHDSAYSIHQDEIPKLVDGHWCIGWNIREAEPGVL